MNLMESLMAQGISASSGGSNLTPEVKEALLDCFANVAWANDDGQQYYDALQDALYGLQSISAVYTQSGTVYDTDSLDSLKADLVVTALYGDGSTQTVPAESYTLSGTLTEGTSTITVSYGGETATFDVTVTHAIVGWYYPFNGSLLSSGTEDFGFVGQGVYAQGRGGRQCYSHIIPTSGDYTTDTQMGLKAVSPAKFPNFSGDFTIAYWFSTQVQGYQNPLYFTKSQGTGDPANQFFSNVAYNSTWTGTLAKNGNATAGIAFQGAADGRLFLRMTSSNTNTSARVTLNIPAGFDTTAWHHYAVTKKGTTVRFFVDGTLLFTATLTSASVYASNQVAVIANFGAAVGSGDLNQQANGGKMQDLYVAEFCKWEDSFDASDISY